MSKNPRTELNLHTKASCMDSVISANDIVELAEKPEYAAVAVTDLNSVRMFPAVYKLAKERHVTHKIIYGAEIKSRFDSEEQETLLTLLMKNQAGLKNLYRIISEIDGNGLSQQDLVSAHREGMLGVSRINVRQRAARRHGTPGSAYMQSRIWTYQKSCSGK